MNNLSMGETQAPPERPTDLIEIRDFLEMLGGMSRNWFYKNIEDPDFPRIIKLGRSVRLQRGECLRYIQRMADRHRPSPEPPPPPPPVKRGRGRPPRGSLKF